MTAHARSLRASQTDAERLLWAHLRRANLGGARFRRQQPIGPYIVDFYCHRARLVVELDGSQHTEAEHARRDIERDAFLESHGLRVLRVSDDKVLKQLPTVLEEIFARVCPGPLP